MLLPLGRGDHVLDAAVGQGMDLGGQALVDGAERQPAFQHVAGHLLPLMALDRRHLVGAGLGQTQDFPVRVGEGGGYRVMSIQPVGSARLRMLPLRSLARRMLPLWTLARYVLPGRSLACSFGRSAERSLGRSTERPLAGASRWPPRRDAASARSGLRTAIAAMRPMPLIFLKIAGPSRCPARGCGRAACAWSWWPLYSVSKLGIATTPFAPEPKSAGTEFFVCFQIDSER